MAHATVRVLAGVPRETETGLEGEWLMQQYEFWLEYLEKQKQVWRVSVSLGGMSGSCNSVSFGWRETQIAVSFFWYDTTQQHCVWTGDLEGEVDWILQSSKMLLDQELQVQLVKTWGQEGNKLFDLCERVGVREDLDGGSGRVVIGQSM